MNIVIEDYITVWKCQEDYVFNFIDSFQIKNEEIDDYGKYKKVYYEIDYKKYEHFLYNSFSINYNNKFSNVTLVFIF